MVQMKRSPKCNGHQSALVWAIMLCSGLFLGALIALSWLAPDLPAAQEAENDNVFYEAKVIPFAAYVDGSV